MIYLDYAASSPPFPEVVERACAIASGAFGNPGAIHRAGAESRKILQNSRNVLSQLTNVRPEEIFFTSGGTESNNWAVSVGSAYPGRSHILCSAAEHSSVLVSVENLRQKGYNVTYLNPNRDGLITVEAVEGAIRPDTALLCVQAVNNETGVVQDVDALAEVAKKHRVRYFCDGVQSFGHVRQNLQKADLISLSAHKLGGPRGVGCLIVRQPLNPQPMILGGGQEFGLRSGTENVPGIGGFALAAQLSCARQAEDQTRLEGLREFFETELQALIPQVQIAGRNAPRSSILCCRFPGISAEEMVVQLDLLGICASPGAACAARSAQPSHVLLSMGYTPEEASGFLRFSLGRDTTREHLEITLSAIGQICRKRRIGS